MRTSLKKLRAFGIHKNGDGKLRCLHQPSNIPHFDQLARATQDMGDMRDCYDSLLSAAAATANSAYEFSESLKEMGSCLLEKTALNDDEEGGKVLLMMGKVQFELQKLVDNYRSHIFQTITSPSESLLNELRIVEEMKKLSDEKRSVYEYMTTANKEKGRTKSRKGESFSAQELQTAYEEYDEEATLFVFRLKSLKQGQSRSLLTQAARHHASQMCFFKKALKSLETVEPHVKFITEQQHIDYQFKGLDDDDVSGGDTEDDRDDDEDESDNEQGDGQLSFDHTPEIKEHNIFSTTVDSMELDKAVVSLVPTKVATIDQVKENSDIHGDESYLFRGENRATISQSAPLFAEKKFDPAERVRQMRQLSSRKFHSYVLPTPLEQSKSPVTTKADNPPQSIKPKRPSFSSGSINFRHSSPLVQRNTEEMVKKEKVPVPIKLSPPRPSTSGHLPPPPLAEMVSPQRQDQRLTTSDAKTFKRQAFSGPLTDKSWPNKRGISGSGSTDQSFPPNLFSNPLLHTPALPRSLPPRISPNASPTFVSSPQISELHELPRPPPNKLGGKNLGRAGHSGPLMSRKGYSVESVWGLTFTNRMVPKSASPLPPPPLSSNFSPSLVTMARSFSIPSSREKGSLGITQTKSVENMHSPPLTPMKFSSIEPTTSASSERMM